MYYRLHSFEAEPDDNKLNVIHVRLRQLQRVFRIFFQKKGSEGWG